jgi:hypothetical protein
MARPNVLSVELETSLTYDATSATEKVTSLETAGREEDLIRETGIEETEGTLTTDTEDQDLLATEEEEETLAPDLQQEETAEIDTETTLGTDLRTDTDPEEMTDEETMTAEEETLGIEDTEMTLMIDGFRDLQSAPEDQEVNSDPSPGKELLNAHLKKEVKDNSLHPSTQEKACQEKPLQTLNQFTKTLSMSKVQKPSTRLSEKFRRE